MPRLTFGALAAISATLLPSLAGAQFNIDVVMSGLNNPRGLAFDLSGNVYVAEAGLGGNGPGYIAADGQFVQYGETGSVSRLFEGVQQRIIIGLPSVASQDAPAGQGALGLHDIAFSASGDLYGTFGLSSNLTPRVTIGGRAMHLGTVSRLPLGGPPQTFADVGIHESAFNPDGGAIDTNPYGLTRDGDGFYTVDAGGNSLLSIDWMGNVRTVTTFPSKANPLPFGPPMYESVPTNVEMGPDGNLYVGELTGFPFPQGGAEIYRIDPISGVRTSAFGGFTNIIDMDFGVDGNLYVLQMTTNGLASGSGPGPGALIKVDMNTGVKTTLVSSPMFFPGGLLAASDGSFYVSNLSTSPGGGQVLHITPVPEPGTVVAIGAGVAVLLIRRRRVR